MGENLKTICWLMPPGGEVCLSAVLSALEGQGCQNVMVAPPEKGLDLEWLEKNLPESLSAVVVSEAHFHGQLTEVLTTLRESLQTKIGAIPVILAVDEGKQDQPSGWMDVGADVFCFTNESPEHWLAHLQSQFFIAQERAAVEEKLREQAVEIARNETSVKQREEFLSVCAHDLRSPLGLIKSCLSMILSDAQATSLRPLQKELLTRAKRQATHAITLVNDLLDVMSLEQGLKPHYHLINLHNVLQDFYSDFKIQAEQKNIKLHYENPIEHWQILADADRIQQLFQNLITNALKFTGEGKNIYLKVSPFRGRRQNDPEYQMVVISLRDEGRGIPPRELQNIFDRFSQIKEYNRADGRGLGLSVAKQISMLHDGNIWVQSVEGEGSTFFVLFPHVVSIDKSVAVKRDMKRIIVAEAVDERRETFYNCLRDWGYEVHFVKDWVSAVALAFHHPPGYILFGEDPGKMGDYDVVNILREDDRTTNIPLILASESPENVKSRIEDTLIDAFLPLPFDKKELEKVLSTLSQKSSRAKSKAA